MQHRHRDRARQPTALEGHVAGVTHTTVTFGWRAAGECRRGRGVVLDRRPGARSACAEDRRTSGAGSDLEHSARRGPARRRSTARARRGGTRPTRRSRRACWCSGFMSACVAARRRGSHRLEPVAHRVGVAGELEVLGPAARAASSTAAVTDDSRSTGRSASAPNTHAQRVERLDLPVVSSSTDARPVRSRRPPSLSPPASRRRRAGAARNPHPANRARFSPLDEALLDATEAVLMKHGVHGSPSSVSPIGWMSGVPRRGALRSDEGDLRPAGAAAAGPRLPRGLLAVLNAPGTSRQQPRSGDRGVVRGRRPYLDLLAGSGSGLRMAAERRQFLAGSAWLPGAVRRALRQAAET